MLPIPWYRWNADHHGAAADRRTHTAPTSRRILAFVGGPLLLWLILIVALGLDLHPPLSSVERSTAASPATLPSASLTLVAIAPGTPLGRGCDAPPRSPARRRPWSPFTALRRKPPRDHAICSRIPAGERPAYL